MPIKEPNLDLLESQEQEEEGLAKPTDSLCLRYSSNSKEEEEDVVVMWAVY